MNEVKVTEIKMPFMSMVTFMVKWAFAAIPAGIIIFFIWLCLSGLVMATLRSMEWIYYEETRSYNMSGRLWIYKSQQKTKKVHRLWSKTLLCRGFY